MQPLLALLPLLLFAVLLVGLRQSAALAGTLSAALCLIVAVAAFDYAIDFISALGPLLEAVFNAASILWILFPALAIYEFQNRTGATETMVGWLRSVSTKPQIAVLLIAWFLALFLEGAAGFGTPIALVAPMLVALGFTPLKALVMALFGHAAGVSFGAVGTPIVPLLAAAAVDPAVLSLLIVLPHAAVGALLVFILFRLAEPKDPAEAASWIWTPTAAFLFFGPAAALAWFAGPELPTVGGAFVGLVLFAALARSREVNGAEAARNAPASLLRATAPYVLVLLLILCTRLFTPVADFLRGVVLRWDIDGTTFGGAIAPFYHPGTVLIVALALAALFVGRGRSELSLSLRGSAIRLPPVALALVSVLLLARLMVHSGMIDALARSAVALMGPQWPIAAPLVAALGSFVTGSATASNILLADFQVAAGGGAGISPLVSLASQGFGSAIGNVVAPHNIIAGAATVGLVGREGDVLKRTLPVCLTYALTGGALLFLVARVL